MINEIKYEQVSIAELKADVYSGINCDETTPYWEVYSEGDMDSEKLDGEIIINVESFPIGTKIIIQEPCCPKCDMFRELCELDDECDFDWNEWVDYEYS